MSVLDDIKQKVAEIASDRGLTEPKAFGYWFLEEFEELSEEDAELTITDGPWDGGRDAVYLDEESKILKIYQFKYSEDQAYVMSAFEDLQNAVQNEQSKLGSCITLKLYIVTICTADPQFFEAQKRHLRRIRTWLTRQGYKIDADVETYDLKKFAQLFERIYGLDLEISFRSEPIESDGMLLGLLDGHIFTEQIEREELFAFNIRKFLGLRKGSVNYQIRQTLEDEGERESFWVLNNGIVCLCTDYTKISGQHIRFANFTIVNGAQTVSTIAKFLQLNPTVDQPIWVLAKIIKVSETDLEYAIKLTKTSNTQTPTNSKDLRAVDACHRKLRQWLDSYFGITYIYRRGERPPRSASTINMKDLAQSYVAYWMEEPHVSFARAGTIFSNSDYYDTCFPSEEIEDLWDSAQEAQIKAFLKRYIVPHSILAKTRAFIKTRVASGEEDKKWKSIAYHIVWIYKWLFDMEGMELDEVYNKLETITETTLEKIFEGITDFCITKEEDVPRDFKTSKLKDDVRAGNFLETSHGRRLRTKIRSL